MLRVTVPQTNMSAIAEFYIVPREAATLLGRKMSEMLAILKVGITVNNRNTNVDNAQPLDRQEMPLGFNSPKFLRAWAS